MNPITQMLDAITDNPPASSIDIDALIAREGARARRARWATGAGTAASAALIAAAALGLPGLLGHGPAPSGPAGSTGTHPGPVVVAPTACPMVTPAPTVSPAIPQHVLTYPAPAPTENCVAAVTRLDAAVADLLATVAPGARLVDGRTFTRPEAVQFRLNQARKEYQGSTGMLAGDRRAILDIILTPSHRTPNRQVACSGDANNPDCRFLTTADGVVAGLWRIQDRRGPRQYLLRAFRPDGTEIELAVLLPNEDPTSAAGLPLTEDQVIRIGTDTRLTLFP